MEEQNEDKTGYDISMRTLFYCCRMISSQQGVEFSTDAEDPVKYGNIKKVYSIWICAETAEKRANSIVKLQSTAACWRGAIQTIRGMTYYYQYQRQS